MTKKFSEYDRKTSYDLPEIIDPERICICLEIPNERYHIRAFWTALYKLTFWNTWEADADKTGTKVASVWREVLRAAMLENEVEIVGCGCDDRRIIRQFYDENGNLWVEYDDGETEARPDLDARVTSPVFPELPGENTDAKRCAAAESIVKTIDDDFIQAMEETNTSTQLLGLLIAMLAIFLSAGTLAPLVMGLIFAILSFGIAATKSAFTPEVLDQFRCILYCNMLPDSSFNNAAWLAVKQETMSTFTGIVQTLLVNTVNAAGEVGLTNMARSGKAASGDCDDCECADDCGFITDASEGGWDQWEVATERRYPDDFNVGDLWLVNLNPSFYANGYGSSPNQVLAPNHTFDVPCMVNVIDVFSAGESQPARMAVSIKANGVWTDVGNQVYATHSGGVAWHFDAGGVLAEEIQIQFFADSCTITGIYIS